MQSQGFRWEELMIQMLCLCPDRYLSPLCLVHVCLRVFLPCLPAVSVGWPRLFSLCVSLSVGVCLTSGCLFTRRACLVSSVSVSLSHSLHLCCLTIPCLWSVCVCLSLRHFLGVYVLLCNKRNNNSKTPVSSIL